MTNKIEGLETARFEKHPCPNPRPKCRHDRITVEQGDKFPVLCCVDCSVQWDVVLVTGMDVETIGNGFKLRVHRKLPQVHP